MVVAHRRNHPIWLLYYFYWVRNIATCSITSLIPQSYLCCHRISYPSWVIIKRFSCANIEIQTLIQMIAGYMHQGKPIANMYFTLYGYNTQQQALLMLRDLKLGQYIKIPPRVTFTAQVLGTVIGSIFNYIMMNQIIDAQTPDLLNPVGSTTWSGQQPQTFNSQAITWALASELFSVGKPYFWVPIAFVLGFVLPVPLWLLHRRFPKYRFDYINIPVISWYAVDLSVGINSSIWSTIAIGAFSQFYMRKYRPGWFRKYNYILSAGLDGGTQVIVFVLTFAIFGASGKYIAFPTWAGNPNPNLDLGANNLTLANDVSLLLLKLYVLTFLVLLVLNANEQCNWRVYRDRMKRERRTLSALGGVGCSVVLIYVLS